MLNKRVDIFKYFCNQFFELDRLITNEVNVTVGLTSTIHQIKPVLINTLNDLSSKF